MKKRGLITGIIYLLNLVLVSVISAITVISFENYYILFFSIPYCIVIAYIAIYYIRYYDNEK